MGAPPMNDAPMPPGLAARLREETKPLHVEVERAGIMPALLRGALDRGAYCRLLRNLFEIYDALELALRRCAARPEVAPIVLPALFRADALAADLRTVHGSDWPSLAVAAAASDYAARLREIEVQAPARLAAHAYVRYLGDVSGGQIVGRIVGASLRLAGDHGQRFYAFGDRSTIRQLAARFRRGLDSTATSAHADEIVAEAKLAFRLHKRLFEELAG
jgi:heme oxygenase